MTKLCVYVQVLLIGEESGEVLERLDTAFW